MELNERLDKELERRFEDLGNLETGSDEQGGEKRPTTS